MQTAHWISVFAALGVAVFGAFQTVFWFLIRSLQASDRELQSELSKLAVTVQQCRAYHDKASATREDIARLEGMLTGFHRRQDVLLLMLAKSGLIRAEDALSVSAAGVAE